MKSTPIKNVYEIGEISQDVQNNWDKIINVNLFNKSSLGKVQAILNNGLKEEFVKIENLFGELNITNIHPSHYVNPNEFSSTRHWHIDGVTPSNFVVLSILCSEKNSGTIISSVSSLTMAHNPDDSTLLEIQTKPSFQLKPFHIYIFPENLFHKAPSTLNLPTRFMVRYYVSWIKEKIYYV